ncbi:MAG: hypothetical protein KAI26_03660 [Nanoarchaeota archaeon]|nr:hypothetical protein [Nanoarchaeota archaeon]
MPIIDYGNGLNEGNNGNEGNDLTTTETKRNSGIGLVDLQWIGPLLVIVAAVGWQWKAPGILILLVFFVFLITAIILMARDNIWWTSGVQNAAVGIMWGTGNSAVLHRLIVILGDDVFWLDGSGNRHEAFWFEKEFNIWWMGPIGSVYTFETLEVEEVREEVESEGQENVRESRKIVRVLHNHINIDKEETLVLLIPPIPCAENFDVIISVTMFYIIKTARDALKAWFNVTDIAKAMSNKTEAAIKTKVGSKTFDELRGGTVSIEEEAWTRLDDGGHIDEMKQNWGVQVNHFAVKDVTAEKVVADALKSVAIEEKNAKALVTKSKGISDSDVLLGIGEKSRTTAQYEGFADGYAKVAAIANGAGIRMEQLRTLQIMPNAKIISMPDFTGALSDATGKNERTLAADLIAAGFTLEQFQQEFFKAKQQEEGNEEI